MLWLYSYWLVYLVAQMLHPRNVTPATEQENPLILEISCLMAQQKYNEILL
jgi:hypothetical protein